MSEEIIFQIILHAGNARAEAYNALQASREGNYDLAASSLRKAGEEIGSAHKVQTDLIQQEVQGQKMQLSLLMVHAQDHLMTAIAEKSLIETMVSMQKQINKLEHMLEAAK